MFTVIRAFVDVADGCRLCKPGEAWPRPGCDPDPAYLRSLLGAEGRPPLIAGEAAPEPAPRKARPKAKK